MYSIFVTFIIILSELQKVGGFSSGTLDISQ